MFNICDKYINAKENENGVLESISFNVPDDFNFAFDVVDRQAQLGPDRLALLWTNEEGQERRFTFADIKRMSDKTANFFSSLGIGRGDVVMLVLKRHYQFWFSIIALHKLGAVVIPATHLLTKKDFVYRFNAADVKMVVCTAHGDVCESVDEAQPESESLKIKVVANGSRQGWISFDEGVEAASDTFARPSGDQSTRSGDDMLMYFTSGTSGMPKMVAHDYTYPIGHIMTAKYWQNVSQDGLHLTVADTGWGKAAWGKLYGQWFCGTAIFVYDMDKFKPAELLEVISKYKITSFCAPPTIYRFFIKEDLKKYDLSSLKYACIAGEALNPEVFYQFYEATGIKLMEAFGQTETTPTVITLRGMEPKPGSMGRPNPAYDVAIVDEDGNLVQPGVVGEIVIRTDKGKPVGMAKGYYRDPKLTARTWRNGFYHTGDTAWADEDGYLWYVGRTDDIIKSSGYRIGPFEIESVLIEHPAVLECAVIGVPDEIRGQIVKAVVVLARGYEPSDELAEKLKEHVKSLTAPYKYPRIIEFADELPKTISGKIRRIELRGRALGNGKNGK